MLTAEEGVGGHVGVQGGLEVAGQISSGDSPQDLPALRGQAGVAGAAAATAFLE